MIHAKTAGHDKVSIREQQTGKFSILKSLTLLKPAAVLQDVSLSQHVVDAIQPLLRITAEALEDDPLTGSHTAKIICSDVFYTHIFSFLLPHLRATVMCLDFSQLVPGPIRQMLVFQHPKNVLTVE